MSNFSNIITGELIEFVVHRNFFEIICIVNHIVFSVICDVTYVFVYIKFRHSLNCLHEWFHFPRSYSYRSKFGYAPSLICELFFSFGIWIPVLSVMLLCYELSAQSLLFSIFCRFSPLYYVFALTFWNVYLNNSLVCLSMTSEFS